MRLSLFLLHKCNNIGDFWYIWFAHFIASFIISLLLHYPTLMTVCWNKKNSYALNQPHPNICCIEVGIFMGCKERIKNRDLFTTFKYLILVVFWFADCGWSSRRKFSQQWFFTECSRSNVTEIYYDASKELWRQ